MSFQNEALFLNNIIPSLQAHNCKQVLQEMCRIYAEDTGGNPAHLFNKLWQKEGTETSGIGDGVSIPHLCLKNLKNPYMLFAHLSRPIDFNALDMAPVDLVFMILSPEKDGPYHLRRLATVSRMFRKEQFRHQLRGTTDMDIIHSLLRDPDYRMLAA